MVEGGGLENRCTRKGTVGSNPTSSARSLYTEVLSCPIPQSSQGAAVAGPDRRASTLKSSRGGLRKAAVPIRQFLPDPVGVVLLDVMDSRSDIHYPEILQVLPTPCHNRGVH